MSWKEKMEEWGGGEVSFLSEDGEAITFIVVDDPYLVEGKFKGREVERIACPVVSLDGFTLLIVGKRLARRLSKHEDKFNDNAFTIVRRGEHDDIRTKYELTLCPNKEVTTRLLKWAKENFNKEVVAEALEYAQEIAQG